MKRLAFLFGLLSLTAACGPTTTNYVKSNTTLGRVVV
jgi:hypothetical protein